jgi:hypothetical protein
MLGLGLGVNKSTRGAVQTQDLRLDVDQAVITANFFSDYNIDNGSLTVSQSASVGGQSGWTKYVYPAAGNEANISGLFKGDLISLAELTAGLYWDVEFKIYLEDANDWLTGAGNTEVTTQVNFGNTLKKNNVVPDQVHTFSLSAPAQIATTPSERFFLAWQTTNDLPRAGATFYLKDFKFKIAENETTANIT